MRALEEKARVLILLQPAKHLEVQDLLDQDAADLHIHDYQFAMRCLDGSSTGALVGAAYCASETPNWRTRGNPVR